MVPSSAKKSNNQTPTLAQIELANPNTVELPSTKRSFRPDMFSKFLVLEGPTHWLFRLGFASIFFVNAIFAIAEPASFAKVVEDNVLASAIGYTDTMVLFAIANDIVLATLIIWGWNKRIVYAWAGGWLLMVAGMKLMNLVW